MNVLDRSNSYLKIFTSKVKIDKNLKKWKNNKEELSNLNVLPDTFINVDENILMANNIRPNNSVGSADSNKNSKTFIRRIKSMFRKNERKMSIMEFFSQVKIASKENQLKYVDRVNSYLAAIADAKDMGQQALVDKLMKHIELNKYESVLYANGYTRKLSEEQIVDFIKKSERGICLTYIANFSRPIPKDIINKKKEVDNLEVFDNYVILHYDPEDNNIELTQKEKDEERIKKSDPILFGIIDGSTDLYYIGDWIDKYCDLTLDKFITENYLTEENTSISKNISL